MSDIFLFTPKAQLDCRQNLEQFIIMCRDRLTVFGKSLIGIIVLGLRLVISQKRVRRLADTQLSNCWIKELCLLPRRMFVISKGITLIS